MAVNEPVATEKCGIISISIPRPGWHRVMPVPTPRMAASHPAQTHPGATQHAMSLDSLQKVSGTGRRVAAAGTRTSNRMNHGRDELLIKTNQDSDNPFHDTSGVVGISEGGRRMPSRLANFNQSRSKSAKLASAARQRPMITNCHPGAISIR